MTMIEPFATESPLLLCAVEDLPLGLGRAFEIAGRCIAVFRTRKGEFFAVDNKCPHKGGPLSEGMLARDSSGTPQVVCPLHQFRFAANTGECDQPGTCPVATYPVFQREGNVYIKLSSDSTQN